MLVVVSVVAFTATATNSIHTHICFYMFAFTTRKNIHICYIYIYIYICIHTYVYIYMYMYVYILPPDPGLLGHGAAGSPHRPSDAAGAQFGRSREEPHKPSMKSFKGLGFRDRIKPS